MKSERINQSIYKWGGDKIYRCYLTAEKAERGMAIFNWNKDIKFIAYIHKLHKTQDELHINDLAPKLS